MTKKHNKPDFVLAVLTHPSTNIKTLTKFYLSTKYGIAVQCVVSGYIYARASLNMFISEKWQDSKIHWSVLQQCIIAVSCIRIFRFNHKLIVMIRINAKLGGINFKVASVSQQLPSIGGTMIIGIFASASIFCLLNVQRSRCCSPSTWGAQAFCC